MLLMSIGVYLFTQKIIIFYPYEWKSVIHQGKNIFLGVWGLGLENVVCLVEVNFYKLSSGGHTFD